MSWRKQRNAQNIFHFNEKGNHTNRSSSLSNLVDNLAEEINQIKCKDCHCFHEYESVKDNLINHKYLTIKIIQTSLMKN